MTLSKKLYQIDSFLATAFALVIAVIEPLRLNYLTDKLLALDIVTSLTFILLPLTCYMAKEPKSTLMVACLLAIPIDFLQSSSPWRLLLITRLIWLQYEPFQVVALLTTMTRLALVMLLGIHWLTCIWHMIVAIDGNWTPPKDIDFHQPGETPLDYGYLTMQYYAILALVGANDPMPRSNTETLVASAMVLAGSLCTGVLVGEFSQAFTGTLRRLNASEEQAERIVDQMQEIGVPDSLQQRVLGYLEVIQSCKLIHHATAPVVKNQFTKDQIADLQRDQLHQAIVKSKLLTRVPQDRQLELNQYLLGSLEPQFYQRDEVILQ